MNCLSTNAVGTERSEVSWEATPARIAGIYLVFGLAALYVSDVVLPALIASESVLSRLQFVKGFVEIGVTTGLIYVLTARSWRSLQETNEHLDAARQGLSVIHRIFRHNLRNDLTVVAGHAESLDDEIERPPMAEHVDVIRDRCNELITSTEKAKLAAELNRTAVEPTEVDLGTTIHRVRERIESRNEAVALETTVPADATVLAHEYVEFAILEVVENAIIHSETSSPTVRVDACDAPEMRGWLELSIEDEGPGIPEGELDAFRTEDDPLEHGSGVGLWMASWIVYRSGGDLDIENTDTGCLVTITLPTPATSSNRRAKTALGRFLA